MSSSVGNSSLLNLALLNQLLQRAGADTTDATTSTDNVSAQDTGSTTSFSAQADALLNALDTDGDGKLSKSELQTGFQKLSQDMRSFLIEQQDIGGEDGASATSPTEPASDPSTAGTATGDDTSQIVDRLLQAIGTGAGATNTASAQATKDTAPSWDSWVQQMQGSNTGDVANQAATNSLQRSMALDAALTQLLQAAENSQTGLGTTTLG